MGGALRTRTPESGILGSQGPTNSRIQGAASLRVYQAREVLSPKKSDLRVLGSWGTSDLSLVWRGHGLGSGIIPMLYRLEP